MSHTKIAIKMLVCLSALLLTACGGGSSDHDDDDSNDSGSSFQLQLLHASDQEAGAAAVADAPRFSAVLNALGAEFPDHTVVLSSGDAYIPGPFFSASEDPSLRPVLGVEGPGRADILIQNELGFQAIAFGNHEFDLGPSVIFSLLAPDMDGTDNYPGAHFPYLSTNLDFSNDADLSGLVTASGQEASTVPNSITGSVVITVAGERTPDPEVAAISAAIGNVLIARESSTFGRTLVYLNGLRASVRTEETNLGDLTADANLFVAQSFDPATTVSIKNGGGIRDDIGEIIQPAGSNDPNDVQRLPPAAVPAAGKEEGQISQFDIQNALRFNNELSLVTVTAQGLKDILEHGVSATEPGATPGQFPQVGGVRFSFDPSLPPGNRVRSVFVLDDNGANDGVNPDIVVQGGMVQGDPNRSFRVVTLSFLIDDADGDGRGGDDYPFPSLGTNRVDLIAQGLPMGLATFADPGSEQDALAEFLAAVFPDNNPFNDADLPASQDVRIQNLSVRNDTVPLP